MLRYFLIPVLLLAACLAAAPAYAGCSSPTGNEADQIYNQASHTWQYCNGTSWVSFSPTPVLGGGGSGCSNPTGKEADQIYNLGCHTWQFCNGTSWVSTTPQACYQGPGDIVSGATAWYGLRAYNAAYTTGTNKAINIRRASDNTTTDIVILMTGALDTATASTFCASTTCYVDEWYDQSGNGINVSEATAAHQPQLVFNCISSLPCIEFTGGSSVLVSSAFTTVASPQSSALVLLGLNAGGNDYFQTIAGNNLLGTGGANGVRISQASSFINATATDNKWHSFQGVLNGSSSGIDVDGTFTSGSTGARATGTQLGFGNIGWSGGGAGFWVTEAGMWPIAFNSTQYNSLCHNQYLYWGTSTAC